MTSLHLEERELALLRGAEGPAMQLAMTVVERAARILRAPRLVPITFAHIDSCFYAGEAHVDFARFLVGHEARLAVPSWTNSGTVSLADPGLRPEVGDAARGGGARRLMELYVALGCKPVWTCAPYQLPGRPQFGDHIVAGESNAVTFYNSVIGARTNKYGDYLDVACALIGKAPFAGLHTDAARRGALLIDVAAIAADFRREDIFYHLLGHYVGRLAGQRVPVIDNLDAGATEDNLKALSAAAAASGGVELWHGVGITPEAQTRDQALDEGDTVETRVVTPDDLLQARAELSSGRDGLLDMVALGTPHFSLSEFAALTSILSRRQVKAGLTVHVSTNRYVKGLAAERGWIDELETAGVNVAVDTCTYFSPPVRGAKGRVMTNAAKWAYYAPGFLGVEVVFGSLKECVESAVRGEVWRDPDLWKPIS
ncbi:MAG: aconitase X catalytic domain-containing protein [Pseudomonadota bacterium]|nr:aconitase X catalytic domain-containing protein [Pseudomonadota bacterium]